MKGLVVAMAMVAGIPVSISPAVAAEPADSAEIYLVDPIVVTATRTRQRLTEVPANVTVITRQEVERSPAQTVDDLLRQVPGFNLLRQGGSRVGPPGTQPAALRGLGNFSSSRTLVMVDGMPVNDPLGGWIYWGRIPRESIERIEVVRGGGSTIWGNTAMGGIINIVTRRPRKRTANVLLEGGNRGTGNVDVYAGDLRGSLAYTLTGNYFHTDGFKVIREDQLGPVDIDANSEHTTVGGRLDYALGPRTSLFLQGDYFMEEKVFGTEGRHNSLDAGHVRAGMKAATSDGSEWSVDVFTNLQKYVNVFSSVADDRASEVPAVDQYDVPSTFVGADLQWLRSFSSMHRVTAGVNYQWVDAEVNEEYRYIGGEFTRYRNAGSRRHLAGLYLQEIFMPTPAWELTLAARLDSWRNVDGFRFERDLQSGETVRDEEYPDRDLATLNPSLMVLRRVSESVSLRGSAYRAFRAPNINSLYRPFRARGNVIVEANSELDPERLTGAELGIDWSASARLRTRVTGFWNELEDPIYNVTLAEAGDTGRPIDPCGFVPAGGTCGQRQNIGKARSRGVEAEASLAPTKGWGFTASYAYLDTEVLSAPRQPALVGQRIRQAPMHAFTLGQSYSHPARLTISVQERFVGKRFEDDLGKLEVAELFVVDLSATKGLGPRHEVFLAVENVFDRVNEESVTTEGLVGIALPVHARAGARLRF